MLRGALALSKLQLINLFGINELKYTKDSVKRKNTLYLIFAWTLVGIMASAYMCAMSYGLVKLNAGHVVPMYAFATSSLLVFVITVFRARGILFSMKGYEIIIATPVSKMAVLISRMFYMYVTNLATSLIIMVPVIAVYGVLEKPGIYFYLMCVIGTIFLPIIPITVAAIVGVGVAAIGSRAKHKSIIETLAMIIFVVVLLTLSYSKGKDAPELNIEILSNIAKLIEEKVGGAYAPALWFNKAVYGEGRYIWGIIGISLIVGVLFIAVVQRYFYKICSSINSINAKNDYTIGTLNANSVFKALWIRELRRFFSSSMYVTNTVIGYVLATIFAGVLFFIGPDKLISTLNIPDGEAIFCMIIPFIMGLIMSISNMTACSISMEGKTMWRLETIPVPIKKIYYAKICASITVASPFYLLSVIFACLAVKGDILESLFIIIIPALYIVFISFVGLMANRKFKVLNWDNEMLVIKQSTSVLITMISGIVSGIIPIAISILLGIKWIVIVEVVTCVMLVVGIFVVAKKLAE